MGEGAGPGVEKYWVLGQNGESIFSFLLLLLPFPLKEAQQRQAPSEDMVPRVLTERDLGMKVPWARNVNMQKT